MRTIKTPLHVRRAVTSVAVDAINIVAFTRSDLGTMGSIVYFYGENGIARQDGRTVVTPCRITTLYDRSGQTIMTRSYLVGSAVASSLEISLGQILPQPRLLSV